MKTGTIAIADDHILLREGLASYLTELGLNVVIKAGNGRELIEEIKRSTLLPKFCLIDYQMPLLNGIETLKFLKEMYPETKVIVYSMNDYSEIRNECLRYGAEAFLLKGTQDDMLASILLSN